MRGLSLILPVLSPFREVRGAPDYGEGGFNLPELKTRLPPFSTVPPQGACLLKVAILASGKARLPLIKCVLASHKSS